jgi:hypothetical protein
MIVRQVIVLGLGGLLLWGCVGCSAKKADVEIPTSEIPLPKQGPVAAPAGPQPGNAGQPGGQAGPQPGKAIQAGPSAAKAEY